MATPRAADFAADARPHPSPHGLVSLRRAPLILLIALALAAAVAVAWGAGADRSGVHGGRSLWIKGTLAYQPRAHWACHCPNWYGPAGRLPPPAPGVR